MAIRSENTINQLISRCKANAFAKMMLFGESLSKGVAYAPSMERQLLLIWACENDSTTLTQKNVYADELAGDGSDIEQPDYYVSTNYWGNNYAQ